MKIPTTNSSVQMQFVWNRFLAIVEEPADG